MAESASAARALLRLDGIPDELLINMATLVGDQVFGETRSLLESRRALEALAMTCRRLHAIVQPLLDANVCLDILSGSDLATQLLYHFTTATNPEKFILDMFHNDAVDPPPAVLTDRCTNLRTLTLQPASTSSADPPMWSAARLVWRWLLPHLARLRAIRVKPNLQTKADWFGAGNGVFLLHPPPSLACIDIEVNQEFEMLIHAMQPIASVNTLYLRRTTGAWPLPPNLLGADLHATFPRLTSLHLHWTTLRRPELAALLDLPTLKSLSVRSNYWGLLPQEDHQEFEPPQLKLHLDQLTLYLPELYPPNSFHNNLKLFSKWMRCITVPFLRIEGFHLGLHFILPAWPNGMHSLSLSKISMPPHTLYQCAPVLHTLHLNACSFIGDRQLPLLPRLSHLSLTHMNDLSELIASVVTQTPTLESVQLTQCTLSDATVSACIMNAPRLTHLALVHCQGPTPELARVFTSAAAARLAVTISPELDSPLWRELRAHGQQRGARLTISRAPRLPEPGPTEFYGGVHVPDAATDDLFPFDGSVSPDPFPDHIPYFGWSHSDSEDHNEDHLSPDPIAVGPQPVFWIDQASESESSQDATHWYPADHDQDEHAMDDDIEMAPLSPSDMDESSIYSHEEMSVYSDQDHDPLAEANFHSDGGEEPVEEDEEEHAYHDIDSDPPDMPCSSDDDAGSQEAWSDEHDGEVSAQESGASEAWGSDDDIPDYEEEDEDDGDDYDEDDGYSS